MTVFCLLLEAIGHWLHDYSRSEDLPFKIVGTGCIKLHHHVIETEKFFLPSILNPQGSLLHGFVMVCLQVSGREYTDYY